ncbi:predicted protein [Sclerotinia sclerotiorum 1980 UF-70]|uniref:Uncharacterized protein n=1 Tax=Sclerotinia sclerotiorum (strain ATCC 18683 / 1980 / Ss-1) TaxID=665079 RepID=A7EPJ9_SCLS1|nr:predicted protein [Sclerotinia sclerotiorum 1980 UF-70]EDO04765.1 predicted protein [Sclerotinia sclerotiorum 1980 UF-70]
MTIWGFSNDSATKQVPDMTATAYYTAYSLWDSKKP